MKFISILQAYHTIWYLNDIVWLQDHYVLKP